MKLIKTTDAEGAVLCHDITQIIRGVTKDAVFRKGHIVTREDIPVLLSVGKDQLYVWEKQEGMLHEDEAAEILCRMCIGETGPAAETERQEVGTERQETGEERRAVGAERQETGEERRAVGAERQETGEEGRTVRPESQKAGEEGRTVRPESQKAGPPGGAQTAAGENPRMSRSQAKEGKIEISAACDGLLKVHSGGLKAVNGFGQMMIATRHGGFAVKKGDKLAGTRIIPLVIEEEKMMAAERACREATGGSPILQLLPFSHKKVGIVTTGNEVFYGRIEDTFTPVIRAKFAEYDTEIIGHEIWNDDDSKVTAAILRMIEAGADIVCCTGGMSVDPDDKTPLAIRNTGAEIVSYGAPVLPGAMFLLAYYEVRHDAPAGSSVSDSGCEADHKACRREKIREIGKIRKIREIREIGEIGEIGESSNSRTVTVMGLPGCVMYAKRTIFDLILSHVMADDRVSASDLAALGEGGLCLNCPVCTFPNCGFGKGG